MKNLARDVESIALALSEEGGYEYYHIDDNLKELAKNVSDMQAENAKLRELLVDAWGYINHTADASWTHTRRKEARDSLSDRIRELGIEVDE